MSRAHAFLALLAITAVAGHASAQDTFTIKLKRTEKGSVTREQHVTTKDEILKLEDGNGNVAKDDVKHTIQKDLFQETVLEKPDGNKRPTLLKRKYEKATVKVGQLEKAMPYQGKTVIIEKTGESYSFRYENGKAIQGDDARLLTEEFKSKDDSTGDDFIARLLPSKAVAVGEKWSIRATELARSFDEKGTMSLFIDKCTAEGTLLKAYKQGSAQYGEIHYKLTFPVKSIKTPQDPLILQPGAVLIIDAKVSGCIDGSSLDSKGTLTFELVADARIPVDADTLRLHFSIRSAMDGVTTDLTQK